MSNFSKIRKHHKRYKMRRWLSRHPAWLHRLFRWVNGHTKLLQRMARWTGKKLSILSVLNPFRYIKRMDWYIIKKFIGTYFFSIILII